MSDDPANLLPGGDPPAPAPRPSATPSAITCEFCGCTLTPRGDAMRISDRAKKLRDLEIDHDAAVKKLTTLDNKVKELESQLRAATDGRSARELHI